MIWPVRTIGRSSAVPTTGLARTGLIGAHWSKNLKYGGEYMVRRCVQHVGRHGVPMDEPVIRAFPVRFRFSRAGRCGRQPGPLSSIRDAHLHSYSSFTWPMSREGRVTLCDSSVIKRSAPTNSWYCCRSQRVGPDRRRSGPIAGSAIRGRSQSLPDLTLLKMNRIMPVG